MTPAQPGEPGTSARTGGVGTWPRARASRRWRRTVTLVVGAALLVLAGCTGGSAAPATGSGPVADGTAGASAPGPATSAPPDPDRWRTQGDFRPLGVPAEMVAGADRLDGPDLVAGTSDRPALFAAVRTSPDGRHRLQVSTWDGTAWQPTDVGPGVPGDPQTAGLAGSANLAAIGGRSWEACTVWPYLLVSTDRRTWSPVVLPAALNAASVRLLAVEGSRLVALTEGEAHSAAVIVVDGVDGDPAVRPLPISAPGTDRSFTGLALSGDTIVLTGRQGPDGGGPPTAFRSSDAGRSWAEPAPISTQNRATAWGVTHVASGFVVTGDAPAPDDPEGMRRMAAWSSPDGAGWQAESVPEPQGFRWTDHVAALTAPVAAGDDVVAVAGSSNSRSARLFQRHPSGEWLATAETDEVADGVGRIGIAVPIVQPVGPACPAGLFVAIDGAHGAVVGRVASGVWTTDVTPQVYRDPPHFSALETGRLAVVRQREFLPFGNGGFRTVWRPTLVGQAESDPSDQLSLLPWDPPSAEGAEDVAIGVDGPAEVVLTTRMSDDERAVPVAGWFRGGPDQPWQPTTGFGAEAVERPDGIDRLNGRWLLHGSRADRTGGDEQAMLWTSRDGIAWSRADGDFADGDRSSRITDVCLGPSGWAFAVGWIALTPDGATATVWTEQNGRWQRSILPTDPDAVSSFSRCAIVGGRLEIDGELRDRPGRWTMDPAGTFARTDPPMTDAPAQVTGSAAEPFRLDRAQPVPGGYVATGRLDTAVHTGPVLWLSADGARWTWLPVPVTDPYASVLARANGADLTVLSSSSNVSQAWRLRDIASVIASIPAG